jgi:zinc transport system substrate-binding protein
VKALHWEPETVPDAKALEELKGILQTHPAKTMLWEGAPAAESVALLKQMGIGSEVFAPCGNRPEAGDFVTMMEANVKTLEGVAEGLK